MTRRSSTADRDHSGTGGRMPRPSTRARPTPRLLAALAAFALCAAPAQALPPEDMASDSATPGDRYVYPSAPGVTEPVPSGWLRVPAAVVDVLIVRPMMAAGLVAGAGLSLVVLPFQAPASITDDTAETLADQTMSTFTRPPGQF